MTEKAPSLTPSPKDSTKKKSPTKPSKDLKPNSPQESFEAQGILATTLSQLAEDLKISMLALKSTQIRSGDSFAIEGQIAASGVLENTIVQYRGNMILNRKILLEEHDYRGNEWIPTKNLQIKLVRPNPMADFAWNDKFSVRGPNLGEFQAEVERIAAKINAHCQTREGLGELSAQCKIQGEHGFNTLSVPKNRFQEIIFPSFWNQTNID
jgi:hypothetical protein